MKLWIDDLRKPPNGYLWAKSTNEAIKIILAYSDKLDLDMNPTDEVELIDIDYDAGDYVKFGGDYIRILDFLEEHQYKYPIHIHSMNPVGIKNMRAIIKRNNWQEV